LRVALKSVVLSGGPACGVLAVVAGLVRRGHVELASGPVCWHNEAHTIVSTACCAGLVLARLLLGRALGGKAGRPC
jgi:hypothetical protein